MQYFEDMPLGSSCQSSGDYTFTADDIKCFACQWDPMPFHLDEEVAKQTPLGGLCASSGHIIAAGIKLSHQLVEEGVAAIAALGWSDMHFPRPAFAGDTVRLFSEVIGHRESSSKLDRGIVHTQNRLINQNNDIVAEYKITTMILKRPL